VLTAVVTETQVVPEILKQHLDLTDPELDSTITLQNNGHYTLNDTVSHPRRTASSSILPVAPQISYS